MTVDKDKISKTLKIDFSYLTKNDMKSLDLRKLQSSLWRSQTHTGESAGGVPTSRHTQDAIFLKHQKCTLHIQDFLHVRMMSHFILRKSFSIVTILQ